MGKDKKSKEKSFISYIDDNGQSTTAYVEILEINRNFVKFKTDKNIITIPRERILKIKEKIEDGK
jgi:hypothetical protein